MALLVFCFSYPAIASDLPQESCAFSNFQNASIPVTDAILQNGALVFAKEHKVLDLDLEFESKILKKIYKWRATETVFYDQKTLIIFRLVDVIKNVVRDSREFEVIALKKDGTFGKFEDVFDLPESAVFKIGKLENCKDPGLTYYYVELKGDSLVAAYKSLFTGNIYHGFTGYITANQKQEFDPTPNRSWRVIDGTYSLKRGMTPEVLDIQSYQLDADFKAYTASTMTTSPSGIIAAKVSPWGQSAVLNVVIESQK